MSAFCSSTESPATAIRQSGRHGARPGLLKTLAEWRLRQRQRHQLSRLDDRMLRDIGLDRAAAMREADKPFWVA